MISSFQLDWRVRPLVVVIKQWAKNAGINAAKYSTLSSYTLTIMVMVYLQCGTTPPVLPSLQKDYYNVFNCASDIFRLPFLSGIPPYVSLNKQSLGEMKTAHAFRISILAFLSFAQANFYLDSSVTMIDSISTFTTVL